MVVSGGGLDKKSEYRMEPFIGLPPSRMGPPSDKERRAWLQRNEKKIQIARLLLAAGADVKLTSPDGATALHFAALAYDSEQSLLPIVRDLIRRGATIDARTSEGKTPLQLAVWRKHLEIAKVLVAGGASLDARDGQVSQRPTDSSRRAIRRRSTRFEHWPRCGTEMESHRTFGLDFCHAARFFDGVLEDVRLGRTWGTRRICRSSPSAIEARSKVSSVAPSSAGSSRR